MHFSTEQKIFGTGFAIGMILAVFYIMNPESRYESRLSVPAVAKIDSALVLKSAVDSLAASMPEYFFSRAEGLPEYGVGSFYTGALQDTTIDMEFTCRAVWQGHGVKFQLMNVSHPNYHDDGAKYARAEQARAELYQRIFASLLFVI